MTLAASKWTILEQGMKDEWKWLQVAQQRVPDLSNVTSADYDQYISLYQSLSIDIAQHQAKLMHLNAMAQKLQELVHCNTLQQTYVDSLEVIRQLQEDVNVNLRRLVMFRDTWGTYNIYNDKVEFWLKDADAALAKINLTPGIAPSNMRQFWVSSFFLLLDLAVTDFWSTLCIICV